MGFWAQIAVYAAIWAINKWIIPKEVEDDESERRPEVDYPIDHEGSPVPICYGRVKLSNPRVAWWGDAMMTPAWHADKLELQVGIMFVLSLKVDNPNLLAIYIGETKVWSGDAAAMSAEPDGSAKIPLTEFTASWNDEIEGYFPQALFPGGQDRDVSWYPGDLGVTMGVAQTGNEYLELHLPLGSGGYTAFRKFQYVVFGGPSVGVLLGRRPVPPPIGFEVAGYPDAANGSATRKINDEANPAEILYDIITEPFGRLGISTTLVDKPSFAAAAVTLDSESWGISMILNSAREAIGYMREILFHIDGIIYPDPFTDELMMVLIREDYTVATLDVFDEDDILEVIEFQRTTWEEGFDQIRVTFNQRTANYQTRVALVQNMAAFYSRSPQRVRGKQMRLPNEKVPKYAVRVAARELLSSSTPIVKARLAMSRIVIDKRPGNVFKISLPAPYNITEMVVRVAALDFGEIDDERLIVDVLQDRFAMDKEPFGEPAAVTLIPLALASEITVKQTIEMPQWMGYRAEVEGLVPTRDGVRQFYFARPPTALEIGFWPEISEDAGSTYDTDGATFKRFTQTALVETAYLRTLEPYDTGTGLRIDAISDVPGSLQTRTVAQIRLGSNLFLAVTAGGDEELLAYESATALAEDAAAEVWQVDASVPTYVDETTDFNDAGSADFLPLPATAALGDYCAFGFASTFLHLELDNAGGTAGAGGAVRWEYWNGDVWFPLEDVEDNTVGFTAAVADGRTVTWKAPLDWATTTINAGASLYYVRARVTTVYSMNPIYDQGFIGNAWLLNNVWRGMLDTAPIALAVGTRLWFLDDAFIWLEALGALGLDGDEAMKIRLKSFTGTFTLDTSGLTPEDLQLVQRSMLPYPADKMLIRQLPAVLGDAGLVNEYPGVTVQGLTDKWIVAPEIVPLFSRRLRTQESIRRGDDADEDPDESAGIGLGATTYDLDIDADGGGWVNIDNQSDDQSPKDLEDVAFSTGSSEKIRVRTKRADAAGNLFSFTSPEVLARIAEYRQILVNPHFDDATDGRGWSTVSGTPSWVSGSTSLGFSGKHFRSATGTTIIEQVRKVSGIGGKDLIVRWYGREFSAGTSTVRLQVITEKDDGTDLDTYDSGLITVSQGHWDRALAAISNVNALATQVRVIATTVESVGSAKDGGIDGIDLRVCANVSADLIANGTLNAALTSWTPTNMVFATTNKSEGAGYAAGTTGATCQLYQDTAAGLPGGFGPGDIMWLRCRVRTGDSDDEVTVKVEARSVAPAVLLTVTTGVLTFADTDWHEIDLYLEIPNSTDHFRVQVDGTEIGAAAAPDVQFDDASLYLFDLT